MKTIGQRGKFLEHVMRRHGLENLAVTGQVDGRRGRGRQRLKYLDSLCTCFKLFERQSEPNRAHQGLIVIRKRLWHHIVANVVGDGTAP